jgi:HEAT repeat protein
MVRHLKDPDPAVRVHAAEALGNFSDRRLTPFLTALLHESDEELVKSAVRSLAAIADPAAETDLLVLLKDQRPALRALAAEALGVLNLDETDDPALSR